MPNPFEKSPNPFPEGPKPEKPEEKKIEIVEEYRKRSKEEQQEMEKLRKEAEEIVKRKREERIRELAYQIYEKRMRGEIPYEEVDRILREHNIEPWTPAAEEFMRKWDWEQAEKLYKEELAKQKELEEEMSKSSEIKAVEGRGRTKKEIEEMKKIREEAEKWVEAKRKLEKGESLSPKEVEVLLKREEEKIKKEKEKLEEERRKIEEEKEKLEKEREKIKKEKEITLRDLEKILEEKRNAFIEADKKYGKIFGKMKKKELTKLKGSIEETKKEITPTPENKDEFIEKLKEKGIEEEKAKAIYEIELKKAEYNRAKIELGTKMQVEGISEAEVFKKLILEEREILNKAKIEAWPPKEKGILRKALDWWMRRGTATRLLISTALVTGVVALSGGFSAPAVALFAGHRFVRGLTAVLFGKITGKGVDWVAEKKIKAEEEKALSKLQKEFSLEKFEEVDKEYENLLEKVAGKRRKKLIIKAGVMTAAGAGAVIGLGFLERALVGPVEVIPGKAPSAPTKVEISGIETAQKGDSLWKMIERQLEARYGEGFTSLDSARKTYIIDAIKDKIAENPTKFGLTDIDKIKVGQKIDFTDIFKNEKEINIIFTKADNLTALQIKNIAQNNEVLRTWVKTHPGEALTSEKIEEILKGGKVVPKERLSEFFPEKLGIETSPKALENFMDQLEMENVKMIGFTSWEYEVIKNLKVGKLLEQIPSDENEAWVLWREGKIGLPHGEIYEEGEFARYFKLAQFIRSFKPGEEIKEMTIRQFLRMIGPDGMIAF